MNQKLYRFFKILFLSMELFILVPLPCNADEDNTVIKVGFYEYVFIIMINCLNIYQKN